MTFSWLVTDMDGTLLNSNLSLDKETIELFQDLQKKGTKIVLASGRSHDRLMPHAKALKLDYFGGKLISSNGTKLYDFEKNREEVLGGVHGHQMDQVISTLEEREFELQFNQDRAIYTYLTPSILDLKIKIRGEAKIPEEFLWTSGQHGWLADYRDGYPTQVLLEDLSKRPDYANKLTLAQSLEVMVNLGQDLRNSNLSQNFEMVFSDSRKMEFTPKGVTKGNALAKLLSDYQVQPDQVIAFGDSENDLSMLQATSHFVAMENSLEQVKKQANYHALDNDQKGVYQFVLKYKEEFNL